ncbi:MAG TPA: hypothetical protein DEP37_06120, partial [Algoriphagus sp.]|nr:hypothetical protein [Algoriphagus sp.]
MKKAIYIFVISILIISCSEKYNSPIQVDIASELEQELKDGRLLVIFSPDSTPEPRFGINDEVSSNQVFGMDFEGFEAGNPIILDPESFGYPIEQLKDFPKGEYYVQAFIQKHETFERADGHTVKLPMDQGEGRQWARAPKNIYSTPKKVLWDGENLSLTIDQEIPPVQEPEDTEYIKHIKIKSELLSKFWGRDMYLGAHVLIPEGFDQNPNQYYPL